MIEVGSHETWILYPTTPKLRTLDYCKWLDKSKENKEFIFPPSCGFRNAWEKSMCPLEDLFSFRAFKDSYR